MGFQGHQGASFQCEPPVWGAWWRQLPQIEVVECQSQDPSDLIHVELD